MHFFVLLITTKRTTINNALPTSSVGLAQAIGGRNAGRDFYGAVGSHTARVTGNTPIEQFSVRALQQGRPIRVEGP
jgi:hypothetical protein